MAVVFGSLWIIVILLGVAVPIWGIYTDEKTRLNREARMERPLTPDRVRPCPDCLAYRVDGVCARCEAYGKPRAPIPPASEAPYR